MTTTLDRTLKRLITIDGVEYTVVLDPDGMRLVGKGKRKPEVELRWREVLSGEAGLAAALNASLVKKKVQPAASPTPASSEAPASPAKPAPKTASASKPTPASRSTQASKSPASRTGAKPARRPAKARSK